MQKDEKTITLPRKITRQWWACMRDYLYDEGYRLYVAPKLTEEQPKWQPSQTKDVPEDVYKKYHDFQHVFLSEMEKQTKEDAKPSKGVNGKALNSRPKIIDDCRARVAEIISDLETMKGEYEEWGERIAYGATQDKCNDAVDTLDTQISALEEIEGELDTLLGELPQGFGRD